MTGIELIAEERQRQIEVEGWSAERDDTYYDGELAMAAACYATGANFVDDAPEAVAYEHPDMWPWSKSWWKPAGGRVRMLTKAGALIAAEIDRIQRTAPAQETPDDTRDIGEPEQQTST